ncbi:MAG TPA: hypothetical protein VGP31_11110, partial [Planosporangium sp.]|nr:hypothetical protein [Planosporangium sp.]
GGLVRPMQNRLDRWLDRITAESAAISEHARAYSAGQRATADRFAAQRAGEPVAGEPHPGEPARARAGGDETTRAVPPTRPPTPGEGTR